MKKFFGREKGNRLHKARAEPEHDLLPAPPAPASATTPIYAARARTTSASRAPAPPDEDEPERWEHVEQPPPPQQQQPPASRASSLASIAPRTASPLPPHPKPAAAAAAVSILKSLDPQFLGAPREDAEAYQQQQQSVGGGGGRREGFWAWAQERRGEPHGGAHDDIMRMIGYLTAKNAEDFAVVLDLCEKASASEANAKEAAKALRREFKYGEVPQQLSAAKLWAIMLRNASDVFVQQCMARKFLDALEDVITGSKTSPVVRERLLDVLAAAAFASQPRADGKESKHDGFRSLWRKLKPPGKPDEGYPFDNDDAMFYPATQPVRRSLALPNSNSNPNTPPSGLTPTLRPSTDESPRVPSKEPSLAKDVGSPKPPPLKPKHSHARPEHPGREHSSHSDRRSKKDKARIIPVEEDIRRLFQECKFAHGNAALLHEALAFARPEELEDVVIREFHDKCRNSQELILAQIPWASAGADRSRQARLAAEEAATVKHVPAPGSLQVANATPAVELTVEEQLLAALLEANEVLVGVLRVYDDLERVGIERETEELSRHDVRVDRSQLVYDENGVPHLEPPARGDASSSRSPSPIGARTPSPHMPMVRQDPTHPLPMPPPPPPPSAYAPTHGTALAVPPPPSRAPAGPRSPGSMRTPSPEHDYARISVTPASPLPRGGPDDDSEHELFPPPAAPAQPSAKALGKRPARAPPPARAADGFDPDDIFAERVGAHGVRPPAPAAPADDFGGGSGDEEPPAAPVHYAYDAVAERTRALLLQRQQGGGGSGARAGGGGGGVPMGVH